MFNSNAYSFLLRLGDFMKILEGKNTQILQMLLDCFKHNQEATLNEKCLIQDYYFGIRDSNNAIFANLNEARKIISNLINLYESKFDEC